MQFHGYHGVIPEEKQLGSIFTIDLELRMDISGVRLADNIQSAVDYRDVFHTVGKVVRLNKFNLLETLAETIAGEILSGFPVEETTVTVRKHRPAIPGIIDAVEVQLTRSRNS